MIRDNNCDYYKTLNGFYEYLLDIVKVYEEILPVIKNELAAISEEDINVLNENLKLQQALLYRTKNFDNEICNYTKKLGIKANSLSSLIIELPEEEQLRFYAALGRFAAAVQEISFYKGKCRALLETKLHVLDRMLGENTLENRTYEKDASKVQKRPPKSFETII